jgi:hypothetical protein
VDAIAGTHRVGASGGEWNWSHSTANAC